MCIFRMRIEVFLCLSLLLCSALDASATESFEWRIVNRFRLFDPWFGVTDPPSLDNAGEFTDKLLTLVPQRGRDATARMDGARSQDALQCDSEPCEQKLYDCLYRLSNAEALDATCAKITRANYKELFNFNPLKNEYELARKAVKFTGDLLTGNWIIELYPSNKSEHWDAKAHEFLGCKVKWLNNELTSSSVSCSHSRIRFLLPFSALDQNRPKGENQSKIEIPITVTDSTGKTILLRGPITPEDKLLILLGDSFGSGEGNPDIAGALSQRDFNAEFDDQPIWLDKRCHRSMHASAAHAAMDLASMKNGEANDNAEHRSVTFLSFACSGAKLTEGLLGRYNGRVKPDGVAAYLLDQYVYYPAKKWRSEKRRRKIQLENLLAYYAPDHDPAKENSAACSNKLGQPWRYPFFPCEFYQELPSQLTQLNALADKLSKTAASPNGVTSQKSLENSRAGIELLISIGGNDIGFAPIITKLLLSGERNVVPGNPQSLHESDRLFKPADACGLDCERERYVTDSGFRSAVGMTLKLRNDIDYLTTLFAELKSKITDLKGGRILKPSDGTQNVSQGALKINNVFLISYPDPTKAENGKHCSIKANFLGIQPLDLFFNIARDESKFADTEVVKPLGKQISLIADKENYVLVGSYSTSVDPHEDVFGKRGWCAVGNGKDIGKKIRGGSIVEACDDHSLAHKADWKPYCKRQRWFWTLADSRYTQGPVVLPNLDFEFPAGAMHPTFEAHRFIGYRIFEELAASAPEFNPVAFEKVQEKPCYTASTQCKTREWMTGEENSKLSILVRSRDGKPIRDIVCDICPRESEGQGGRQEAESRTAVKAMLKDMSKMGNKQSWCDVQAIDGGKEISCDIKNIRDGEHRFFVSAKNSGGKEAQKTYSFRVDAKPPTVTLEPLEVNGEQCNEDKSWCANATLKICGNDGVGGEDGAAKGSGIHRLQLEIDYAGKAGLVSVHLPNKGGNATCEFPATFRFVSNSDENGDEIEADKLENVVSVKSVSVTPFDNAGWKGVPAKLTTFSPQVDLIAPRILNFPPSVSEWPGKVCAVDDEPGSGVAFLAYEFRKDGVLVKSGRGIPAKTDQCADDCAKPFGGQRCFELQLPEKTACADTLHVTVVDNVRRQTTQPSKIEWAEKIPCNVLPDRGEAGAGIGQALY